MMVKKKFQEEHAVIFVAINVCKTKSHQINLNNVDLVTLMHLGFMHSPLFLRMKKFLLLLSSKFCLQT